MKALAIALMLAAGSSVAIADTNVGQCLFPKTVLKKDGSLAFKKPVSVFKSPDPQSSAETLRDLSAFTVGAESNGYVQLLTVPDYDAPDPDANAGKFVGWAKIQDFDYQALRNCN